MRTEAAGAPLRLTALVARQVVDPLVVNHARLESALAEFSEVLRDDFVVADVLRRLCGHVASVLPAAEAGVSFDAGDGPVVVCTSGPVAGKLEAAQLDLHEGPSSDVYARGWPVAVQLTSPSAVARWPRLTRAAEQVGVRFHHRAPAAGPSPDVGSARHLLHLTRRPG